GDHGRLFGAQGGDGASPIAGDDDFEIVVGPLELRLEAFVILDDQQFGLGVGHQAASAAGVVSERESPPVSAGGKRTRKRVPSPSRDSTSSRPPMARTSSRASNAPMPNPPGFDEVNGLNSRVRTNSGLMPEPESITSIVAWEASPTQSRNTGLVSSPASMA